MRKLKKQRLRHAMFMGRRILKPNSLVNKLQLDVSMLLGFISDLTVD